MSLVTKEGLFVVPGKSDDIANKSNENHNMELNEQSEEEFLNSELQQVRSNRYERTEDNNIKRYEHKLKPSQPVPLEQQTAQSEQAVKSLTKHMERKICPKSLQYIARAIL